MEKEAGLSLTEANPKHTMNGLNKTDFTLVIPLVSSKNFMQFFIFFYNFSGFDKTDLSVHIDNLKILYIFYFFLKNFSRFDRTGLLVHIANLEIF